MYGNVEGFQALERLFRIASSNTGQARRVANFLLAWHNAEENGGWDPADLWKVDDAIAEDILSVFQLLRERHADADQLGFRPQMQAVWDQYRSSRIPTTTGE